jgi:hypothetical protein
MQGSKGAALELCRTYDFLTQLHDEFEPLRAQLLTCHPCFSLMDDLLEVHNEETHLQDADLLLVSSVLVAHSSIPHPTALVPPASPPVAPSTGRGVSTGLHCDHCD